jgi:hypothetical protein
MVEQSGLDLVGKGAATTTVTGTEIVGASSMIIAGTASMSETTTAGGTMIASMNTNIGDAV